MNEPAQVSLAESGLSAYDWFRPIPVISRMATIDTKRSFQMRFSGAALHCLRAVRAQVFVGKHVLSYCETLCGIRLAVRMPMPPAVLPTALNVTTILDHYEATPSNHCGQKCPRRWGAAGDHWEGCADSQSSNAGIITVRRYADKTPAPLRHFPGEEIGPRIPAFDHCGHWVRLASRESSGD